MFPWVGRLKAWTGPAIIWFPWGGRLHGCTIYVKITNGHGLLRICNCVWTWIGYKNIDAVIIAWLNRHKCFWCHNSNGWVFEKKKKIHASKIEKLEINEEMGKIKTFSVNRFNNRV